MATFDLPEMPEPRVSPNLMVGAASPLWGFFGAATAGGLAYWWMTRWTQTQNLEALFGMATKALAEPALEMAEAVAEAVAEAAEAAVEALPAPVGGESAPISPLVEAMAAPEAVIDPSPEPVLEAVPEPAVEAAPEPQPVEAAAEPAPRPRLRKPTPLTGSEDEA